LPPQSYAFAGIADAALVVAIGDVEPELDAVARDAELDGCTACDDSGAGDEVHPEA
jgi:hypothetical protein